MKRLIYEVAGISICVVVPEHKDLSRLLPTFLPFAVSSEHESSPDEADDSLYEASAEDRDIALTVETCIHVDIPDGLDALVTEENDMGRTEIFNFAGNVLLRFDFRGLVSRVRLCPGYGRAEVDMDMDSEYSGAVLSSVIRTAFAQVVVFHDGLSVHSSTVVCEGKGYMFLGKSGTGKSTHSRLWMKAFPGTWLLNDDNPVIRFVDGVPLVFGTPWSGKTPCYRNASAELAAMVRLSQAPENLFSALEPVQAFIEIYQGTSVLRSDDLLHEKMCDMISRLVEKIMVAHLDCLPDLAAARLCRDSILSLQR